MIPGFFHLSLALRYIFSRRREKYISVISVLSLGGVAISVMTLLVVIAVMGGFERDLKDKITSLSSHITLQNETGILYNWADLAKKAAAVPHVVGVSPYVMGQVMVKNGNKIFGAVIKGIDPETDRKVTDFSRYIDNPNLVLGDTDLVLGSEMRERVSLESGGTLRVLAPTDILTPLGPAPRIVHCRVAGFFNSGMYQYDVSFMLGSIKLGQKLFNLGAGVHGLEIRCEDPEQAWDVKTALLKALQDNRLTAETWMERNRNLFAAVKTEKKVMFVLLMLAVLVSAGNIISTLVMLVMEKTRDIGILKAFGVNDFGVLRVFFLVGTVIGSLGTALGTTLGLLFLRYIDAIAETVSKLTGVDVFPKEVYYLDKIPVFLSASDTCVIVLSALLVSLLSSVYPAWRAGNLRIVEALRYE